VYSFDVAVEINAGPSRVWRALCDPGEVVQWDTGVVEALDAPADYPKPGQHIRWRYANGPFRLLHDRPQEVVAERTLRSLISIGFARFDETYTLAPNGAGCRLTATMHTSVPYPLVGPLIERLYAGPESKRTVETSLTSIKKHCEASP
jgi:uncharacterized protein YndB with AHSA1/START domain